MKCTSSLFIIALVISLSSCYKTITKKELRSLKGKNEYLTIAHLFFIEYDSIRKELGLPIIGEEFYAKKKNGYTSWTNPDTLSFPRFNWVRHNIMTNEYDDSLYFNYEFGRILINDTTVVSYGIIFPDTLKSSITVYSDIKRDGIGKVLFLKNFSRMEFDSIINVYGRKKLMNW